jgi:hypothetical protein
MGQLVQSVILNTDILRESLKGVLFEEWKRELNRSSDQEIQVILKD